MDNTSHAAPDAFLQRFRDLATQFRQNHTAWQEAVRVGNVPLQSALIARERAILTEVGEVIAAFQASIAQRPSVALFLASASDPHHGTHDAW
jgi:hypothetical protein